MSPTLHFCSSRSGLRLLCQYSLKVSSPFLPDNRDFVRLEPELSPSDIAEDIDDTTLMERILPRNAKSKLELSTSDKAEDIDDTTLMERILPRNA